MPLSVLRCFVHTSTGRAARGDACVLRTNLVCTITMPFFWLPAPTLRYDGRYTVAWRARDRRLLTILKTPKGTCLPFPTYHGRARVHPTRRTALGERGDGTVARGRYHGQTKGEQVRSTGRRIAPDVMLPRTRRPLRHNCSCSPPLSQWTGRLSTSPLDGSAFDVVIASPRVTGTPVTSLPAPSCYTGCPFPPFSIDPPVPRSSSNPSRLS